MIKTLLAASLLASASAFAPAPVAKAAAPLKERFDRLRYVEVKHGRISMLAILGNLVTGAGVYLPGSIDRAGTEFSSIPTGFGAFDAISGAGIAQIVGFVGFLELFVMKDVTGEAE
ncbi:hypothetical protein TeGR_g9297 [Tetraparma gracilis]|uniref:Uncharacterized protein n=1 Tax=Tetraparma gracilis TaxID=2962635 RepID=A0ABQ6N162_9STRA|nr:hypothetical protein TeGR_g9297 [Tetraparma gracilis]